MAIGLTMAARARTSGLVLIPTTHRAGLRRITNPGLFETRAAVIRPIFAEDYADAVAFRRRTRG
jgi:hypothetical protein